MQPDGCLRAAVKSRSKRVLCNRAKDISQPLRCKSPPRPGFSQCRGTRQWNHLPCPGSLGDSSRAVSTKSLTRYSPGVAPDRGHQVCSESERLVAPEG